MKFLPVLVACCTFSLFAIEGGFNFSVNSKLGNDCINKLNKPEDDYQKYYLTWGKIAIAICCLLMSLVLMKMSLTPKMPVY